MNTQTSAQLSLLVILSVVFGSAFLLMKVVVDEATPLQIVTARMTVGAVVLGVILRVRGAASRPVKFSRESAALGFIGMLVPFGLSAWAIQHMDSGTGAVLNSTIPIFTGVFAAILIAEERMTPNRAGGLVAGFAGVAVMAGGAVFDASAQVMVAQLAQVTAAASLALAGVYAKRLLATQDALSLSWVQIGFGAVFAWPLLIAFEGVPSFALSAKAWTALIVLGAVQSGIAWAAYVWLIERAGSVRASLLTYLMPPVGLFLGWAFLEEQLTGATIGGLALIVCGIAIVMRPAKAAPRVEQPHPVARPVAAVVPAASEATVH